MLHGHFKQWLSFEKAGSKKILNPRFFILSEIIDLLAILRKSLDRGTFLYIFIREVQLNGVRASIAIVHIRKFYKL